MMPSLPNPKDAQKLTKAQVLEVRKAIAIETSALIEFTTAIQHLCKTCACGRDEDVRQAIINIQLIEDRWTPHWSPGRPSQTREERSQPEKKKGGLQRQRGQVVPPHDHEKTHVKQVFDATPYDTGKLRYSDPKMDPFLLDEEDDILF